MKYSIKFYRGCSILDKVDEIRIKYDKIDAELIDFIKDHPKQKIVAEVGDMAEMDTSLDIFRKAAAASPQFTLSINISQNYELLKDNKIPFFFNSYVDTFDDFEAYISRGVSEIIIAGELGFHLFDIATYCALIGVQIRVYPNICQKHFSIQPSISGFFIRPEAISWYDHVIDTIMFWGDDLTKQDVLYKIYKDGHWNGKLSELILGWSGEDIDNLGLVPQFDEMRLNCKKTCVLDKCSFCDTAKRTAAAVTEKGFQIKEKRKPIKHEVDNS